MVSRLAKQVQVGVDLLRIFNIDAANTSSPSALGSVIERVHPHGSGGDRSASIVKPQNLKTTSARHPRLNLKKA
ncbi:hypothetical protein [Tychonema sp. LEGE 07203]|uniref:hypothetical protein n=1 Tax=Tychonema sp. LEGE 07203 TaxID=1828671 RepID=UPI00187F78CF|nr:hypothetical protein [Tychonema sp. LEGE 07203]MBE9097669.1 hypothetical protein [Tychonema sp. LEGE 07203]